MKRPARKRARAKKRPAGTPRVPGLSRAEPSLSRAESRGLDVQEIESLRAELDRLAASSAAPRWNADPEDVRRSVAKLVLTLVEFIRQILERQAIRRMEAGTLTEGETESVGLALMRLEETVREIGSPVRPRAGRPEAGSGTDWKTRLVRIYVNH